MKINTDKTKVLTFTNRFNATVSDYAIGGAQIEKVMSFKYLGVRLSSNLTWYCHIEHVVNRASKTLGFLKRQLALADQNTKLIAYTTLVRSQLVCASLIWSPYQTYLINQIESLQNKAARFITRRHSRADSITAIKNTLELTALHSRRKRARLAFFHRLFHSSSLFRQINREPPDWISLRLDHPFKVKPIFTRTKVYQNSPLLLAIADWNALPGSIASLTNHSCFLARVGEML